MKFKPRHFLYVFLVISAVADLLRNIEGFQIQLTGLKDFYIKYYEKDGLTFILSIHLFVRIFNSIIFFFVCIYCCGCCKSKEILKYFFISAIILETFGLTTLVLLLMPNLECNNNSYTIFVIFLSILVVSKHIALFIAYLIEVEEQYFEE
uniref:Signal peptidase II n=1 Tax=Strongyloides venezuelensis TaxID=75913 RepID=A0A0K0FAK6_STRVS